MAVLFPLPFLPWVLPVKFGMLSLAVMLLSDLVWLFLAAMAKRLLIKVPFLAAVVLDQFSWQKGKGAVPVGAFLVMDTVRLVPFLAALLGGSPLVQA